MVYRWFPLTLARLAGIEAYEVLQVLHAPRRLPVQCMIGDAPGIAICARTQAGRPLAVAVRKTGPLDEEIMAVRELVGEALRQFEQREGDPS